MVQVGCNMAELSSWPPKLRPFHASVLLIYGRMLFYSLENKNHFSIFVVSYALQSFLIKL